MPPTQQSHDTTIYDHAKISDLNSCRNTIYQSINKLNVWSKESTLAFNTWWPSEAASRLVNLSNYCFWCFFFSVTWSRAYGLCGLSLYTSNDLIYNSNRFKKPSDIFWPQIQRKGSEDYLVMILAVNRKLWAIFLPRVHLEKEQTPGSRLKT